MALLDYVNIRISVLESRLTNSPTGGVKSVSSDGTSIIYEDSSALRAEIFELYLIKSRLDGSAPMLARGVVKGLR